MTKEHSMTQVDKTVSISIKNCVRYSALKFIFHLEITDGHFFCAQLMILPIFTQKVKTVIFFLNKV